MSKRPAWVQQEGETDRHFSWFHAYLMLGTGRSIQAAYSAFASGNRRQSQSNAESNRQGRAGERQRLMQASSSWYKVSEERKWSSRARLWDEEQRREEERERKERRKRQLIELEGDEWEDGKTLRTKARTMLNMPSTDSSVIDMGGGRLTQVKGANAEYFRTATAMIDGSSKLRRRALGLEGAGQNKNANGEAEDAPEVKPLTTNDDDVRSYTGMDQSELNRRIESALKPPGTSQ